MVGGVAEQYPGEVSFRTENARSDSRVHGVVDPTVAVDRVIAPILDIVGGKYSNTHGLQEVRDQQRGDYDIACGHTPVSESHQQSTGLGKLLRNLDRSFFAPR